MSAGAGAGTGAVGRGRVGAALATLRSALTEVDTLDLHSVPTADLRSVLTELSIAQNMLAAQVLRTVERFDASGAHEVDGAVSARSWLRAHTRRSPAEAARLVSTARKARDLPLLSAALREGAISPAHVQAVTAAMDRTPARAATLAEAEPTFTAAARELDPRQLARVVRRWAHTVDPLSAAEAELAVHAQRYVAVSSTFDGAVKIDGLLAPEPGALLMAALEAMSTWDYRRQRARSGTDKCNGNERTGNGEDTADGRSASGVGNAAGDGAERGAERRAESVVGFPGAAPRGPSDPSDERTGGQRRADALVELARRFLDQGEAGEIGQVRPHLQVSVPAATLAAAAEASGQEPAELIGVGPLSGAAARRIGCDAIVSGITLSADGMPLGYGRDRRVVPPALRKVLVARDRGCRFPGCDRQASWCEAHHIVFWGRGGDTAAHNLVMICQFHHHAVHEGGFSITGDPQVGTLAFHRPDGSRLHDRARAP